MLNIDAHGKRFIVLMATLLYASTFAEARADAEILVSGGESDCVKLLVNGPHIDAGYLELGAPVNIHSISVERPSHVWLSCKGRPGFDFAFEVFLEDGSLLEISFDADEPEASVINSPSHKLFTEFQSSLRVVDDFGTRILPRHLTLDERNDRLRRLIELSQLHPESEVIEHFMRRELRELGRSSVRKPVALEFLSLVAEDIDAEDINIAEAATLVARRSPGTRFQEFKAQRLSNNEDFATTASRNHEYTMYIFWSSSCVPCGPEIRKILEYVALLPNNSLQLIFYSFDTHRQRWARAVEKYKIVEYANISSLERSPDISDYYDLSSIPQNIILNDQSEIVASNLFGDGLYEFLFNAKGE